MPHLSLEKKERGTMLPGMSPVVTPPCWVLTWPGGAGTGVGTGVGAWVGCCVGCWVGCVVGSGAGSAVAGFARPACRSPAHARVRPEIGHAVFSNFFTFTPGREFHHPDLGFEAQEEHIEECSFLSHPEVGCAPCYSLAPCAPPASAALFVLTITGNGAALDQLPLHNRTNVKYEARSRMPVRG